MAKGNQHKCNSRATRPVFVRKAGTYHASGARMQTHPRTSSVPARWQFWIDRGGTFTDIVGKRPDGSLVTHKLLSENPERYDDAAVAGMRALLGLAPGEPITAERVDCVKMGTTVATNALLERKGAPTLLVTTQGFRDALRIAYQNRPRLFDRHIVLPELLYQVVVEADVREEFHRVQLAVVPFEHDQACALGAERRSQRHVGGAERDRHIAGRQPAGEVQVHGQRAGSVAS